MSLTVGTVPTGRDILGLRLGHAASAACCDWESAARIERVILVRTTTQVPWRLVESIPQSGVVSDRDLHFCIDELGKSDFGGGGKAIGSHLKPFAMHMRTRIAYVLI